MYLGQRDRFGGSSRQQFRQERRGISRRVKSRARKMVGKRGVKTIELRGYGKITKLNLRFQNNKISAFICGSFFKICHFIFHQTLREIADEQAKKELLEYIKGKESIYPSDIADALRLPMEQVFSIVNKLFVEGRVEEVIESTAAEIVLGTIY